MQLVLEIPDRPLPEGADLPAKDNPILISALAARAGHLLTGDRRHFGPLFGRRFGALEILTPGDYLRRR